MYELFELYANCIQDVRTVCKVYELCELYANCIKLYEL